jgi:beta-galactosidase/beta-glucuronidase
MSNMPRPEHPNPQMQRQDWRNLNGVWRFAFDHSVSGHERGFVEDASAYGREITVPYCFESILSGIGETDFCECVWYRRAFTITDPQTRGRTLLHFGACDFYTEVYLNGRQIGCHRGGGASFTFDVTHCAIAGENTLVLRVTDKTRGGEQPVGKQSQRFGSHGCSYTRTTGIWQTVWLEHIAAPAYIASFKAIADIETPAVHLTVELSAAVPGAILTVTASWDGKEVARKAVKVNTRYASLALDIPAADLHVWTLGQGGLYDLKLAFDTGAGTDVVSSYFGMRSVALVDGCMRINHVPVFQRLVLDQGFYPDGIWTAPSDDALRRDIELSMEVGFNGARLHQKVFEPRFLYWADKLGYMVWGEYGSWGLNDGDAAAYENLCFDWLEAVKRDINHPSIVGWCPFNETWHGQRGDTVSAVVDATRRLDPTRPIIDCSGHWHTANTDIFDVHDYNQDPESFKARYDELLTIAPDDGEAARKAKTPDGIPERWNLSRTYAWDYTRLPYFVSEFGGTWWQDTGGAGTASWGYGKSPESIEAFYARFEALVNALLDNKRICGFCYTELTDVEQEQNGIYTYDRSRKFDPARLYAILTRKAAIEQ